MRLIAAGLTISHCLAVSWLDVPYVQQVKAGCGSAAVAMVMQYWLRETSGLDASAADAARIHAILPQSSKGTPGTALKKYFEDHGFSAFVIDGELKDLGLHLAKGRPLIVCLAPKGPRAPLHYVVVTGLDDSGVIMNDPARGKLFRESRESFLRAWKITGNWTLLAVPRQAQ